MPQSWSQSDSRHYVCTHRRLLLLNLLRLSGSLLPVIPLVTITAGGGLPVSRSVAATIIAVVSAVMASVAIVPVAVTTVTVAVSAIAIQFYAAGPSATIAGKWKSLN